MVQKYIAKLLILFLIGSWSQTPLANSIIANYLTSNWEEVEGNDTVRMYDERKYRNVKLYQYGGTDLYALISQGVLQHSKSMQGICFSEVRISYFMGRELDGVNIQSHKLGWFFYLPKHPYILRSCDGLLNANETPVIGDVSFDDAVYILQNIKKIQKKVSSKEINCENKELLSIFSNNLNVLEVNMADLKGKRFSLILLKAGREIRPDECFEVSN